MCPAAAPAAFSPCASVAPAASAAAFFAAPASSTPTGSFDCSHTTPARMNVAASCSASASSLEAATSPAPCATISCACAGPPMHATRAAPKRARSSAVGGVPSGGTSPFASETTAARRVRPACSNPAITSPTPSDGTARKTSSARASPFDIGSIRSSRGSSTPGRYSAFARASLNVSACARVRVCSVVRIPPRASSTATAVPNEPAPTTTARRSCGGSGSWGRGSGGMSGRRA
jgi:hypothetical protein